ncbi:cytochrome P450 [Serratia fonticola]|uniref:Cytochrome P450 n=1 Tax=Serratia fonticola TaxID=47917 RepID=A0A559SZG0_SERFO|nr:cytochrome P450 [Serratia fonticola]TQI79755.1 cytochrome P450 [Serratia fonticola]TQI98220.1 cytochrome P450 [Serratia fonticola]TVZ67748.1 cytochrome P450 [Serratia fonticola]
MTACPFSVASKQAVQEALSHRHLGVRPPDEPVPTALLATPAQPIFAAMVRMRDDAVQSELKAAITRALATFSDDDIRQTTRDVAARLAADLVTAEQLTRFNYALSIGVLAAFLGIPYPDCPDLVDEVLDFVRCIAPGGSAEQMTRGAIAAGKLQSRMAWAEGPLFHSLCQQIGDRSLAVANAIGLFFQACEGTAGLIGQTLLMRKECSQTAEDPISRVLQQTPPIQTTRRFALQDTRLDGQPLLAGQGVLVHLKTPEASFAFGYGVHQCPGERWARIIAAAGIDYLSVLDSKPELLSHFRWRASQNARVPEFFTAEERNDDCGHF